MKRSKITQDNREIVQIGAHKFWKVPLRDLPLYKMVEEDIEQSDPGATGYALMTYHEHDPYTDFPGRPQLEGAGPFLSSGIAIHEVGAIENDREVPDLDVVGIANTSPKRRAVWPNSPVKNLSARRLALFSEIDWYGEIFQVLEAHNWTISGEVTENLKNRLAPIIDHSDHMQDELKRAKTPEDRDLVLLEMAAEFLAEPLSRVWYAASMQVLYYRYHDDLRLGYLWCEYRVKMRYELFALKHMEMVEKNRASGQMGGQASKKRERLDTLTRLAREQVKDFAFVSDRRAIERAKKLATDYDRAVSPEEQLFSVSGKLLSKDWFADWLIEFRNSMKFE